MLESERPPETTPPLIRCVVYVCVTPTPIATRGVGGVEARALGSGGGRRRIILMALSSDECVNEGRSKIYDFTTFI
jgi:hypothetical protein